MSVRGRVRSPHMAKLQAASVPIAWGSCAPRLGQTDGRIAVSLNLSYSAWKAIRWEYGVQ